MAVPRKLQISLDQTRYYHCMSRCVRRAYLCGKDSVSGRNYEHRRQWIEDRLVHLNSVFAIDLVAYAIMHNHYHVVIRVMKEQADQWTETEVCRRWGALFSVPRESDISQLVPIWRERLTSISWFMRCVNEPIARYANKEDECTGRFWEGRFKLQALLDETALYKCMIYVDLNPIRSGIATLPERSDHTSIKARLERRDIHLVAFCDEWPGQVEPLPLTRNEYVALVDWTGRMILPDKVGHIPRHLPSVFDRLGIGSLRWLRSIKFYGRWYYRAVGSQAAMESYCAWLKQQWLKGMSYSHP